MLYQLNLIKIMFGAIALLTPTIVFHSFAYGRNVNTRAVAASIVVSQFIFSVTMLGLALSGYFYGIIVLILSTIISAYAGYKWNDHQGGNINVWLFTGLFALFTVSIQMISPVLIESDAFSRYLPWARIISTGHNIPAIVLPTTEFGWHYLVFSPHFLHSSLAYLFSLFGTTQDSLIAAVPFTYSVLTVFFILIWTKERYGKSVNFVVPMLISSYAFLLSFHSFLQEVPLFLFLTLGIYYLSEYSSDKSVRIIALTSMAFSLTTQVKYAGLPFSALAFLMLIVMSDKKRRVLAIGIFITSHIPLFIWLVRNWISYSNPFYRLFSKYFSGVWNYLLQFRPVRPTNTDVGFIDLAKNFFIEFPAGILAVWYSIINRKDTHIRVLWIMTLAYAILLAATGARLLMRYFFPLLGILAILAAIQFSSLVDKTRLRKLSGIIGLTITLLGMTAVIVSLFSLPAIHTKANVYGSQIDISSYLKSQSNNTSELVLWGEGSTALVWYSGVFIVTPSSSSFFIATNQTIIPYKKSYIPSELKYELMKSGIVVENKSLNATDFYDLAKSMGADYIYDSTFSADDPGVQETNAIQMEPIYEAAETHPEYFTLVYENRWNAKLWSVN